MRKPRPLGSAFELLEDRSLPSTFGVPWADPEHLTFSFAADGVQTPLGTNTLAQVLSSAGTPDAWKFEILRAFQTWAANANINLGLVDDGGQAIGAVGAVQGDARFGDIRVAAAGLSSDVLASTSPFTWTGSTLSGDMVLNANATFGLSSTAYYNLFSVALHEAGHAFGLDHDDEDEASAIHAAYEYLTGLSATDIEHLQALYGARRADSFDAAASNDAMSKASALPKTSTGQLLATADLTTMADVDYYKFTAPALTSMLSGVYVRLKADGLSLLTASVTIYDSAGRVVASTKSTDPTNNDLVVSFKPGLFGGTYYVKVEGARNDAFDVGAYKLAVDFLSVGGVLAPITTTLTGVLDGGTNETLATALGIQSNKGGADARFDAIYRGVIESTSDVDSYKIRTDKFAAGTLVTLNVMVWGLDSNPVDARVKVFDAAGKPVSFQVLTNDRGLFSVQVLNGVAGKDYYVQVVSREGAVKATGSYFFAADFNTLTPMVFDNVANGTAKAGTTTTAETLTLSKAGVFQFALGATAQAAGDAVTMAVYDEDGNLVFTLTAKAGRPPVTATRYLKAGTYTVKYTAANTNAGTVGYALFLAQISEGVGPYSTSTATPPSSTSPDSTNTSTTSSTSTTPPPDSTPTTSADPPPDSNSCTSTQPSYTYSSSSSSQPYGYYYTY